MKMRRAEEAKYPKFAKYLQGSIEQVVRVPNVRKSLKNKGELRSSDFKNLVTYGQGKQVIIAANSNGTAGSNEIFICKKVVKKFEASCTKKNAAALGSALLQAVAGGKDLGLGIHDLTRGLEFA